MIINIPQVDWLTFTTWEEPVYTAWQKWQSEQVGEVKTGKIRMYVGIWRGSSFIGEGRQGYKNHGLVRVSGSESHEAFYQLSKVGEAKCTRLDVQITIPLPEGYSARKFADDIRAGQTGQFSRSIKLIENSDGLDTVYIGALASDRFARFYVKLVDEVSYLRFEVEHKAEWADIVAKSTKGDVAVLAGVMIDFIESMAVEDSQGVINKITEILNSVKAGLKVGYEVRDKNKTMEWIMEKVTPAMVRLLADHDCGQYLALHLQNLIDRYFLPD